MTPRSPSLGRDTSGLPAGVTLTGFTGQQSETLTITAPLTAAGQTFSITATGKDTRALENMTAYIPSKDSLQKIFLCANTAQVVASASFGVNTPAAGKLQIKKYGDNNAPLAGVKFGVYSDAACATKITEVTTGTDGTVLLDNMNGGTYYVKELSTVRPYVIDGMVNTVIVKASETTTLEVQNETAKGVIRVKKTGEALVGTTVTATEYGQLHTPKYQNGGLAGCEFTVKNESGTVVATLTTDADGVAETGLLPFGTYTVQETGAPAGYELDASIQTVTLAYKDQNTPIVYGEVTATNNRIPTSVKIVKKTDHFNKQTMKFEAGPLEGAVFGLYTAEAIGVIPKNTMVDLLTTDASGMATSSATLPFGKYYLRELKLPDNTIHLSEESYPLTVKGHNKAYVDEPIWTMNGVQRKMNPELYLEGIVIVRRNNVSIAKRTNVENLRQRYCDKVYKTELPSSVKASEAQAHGMSLISYMSWNHLTRAYQALANEVVANEQQ